MGATRLKPSAAACDRTEGVTVELSRPPRARYFGIDFVRPDTTRPAAGCGQEVSLRADVGDLDCEGPW